MENISKNFIQARKEDSCLRLHIANGLYIIIITAFVILGQAAAWTSLTFELSILFLCVGYCMLLLYHLHTEYHPYENESAVQRAVNFLLFFIGLKMAGAVFSMPGMHPVNSLFVVIIVGAFLYCLRCEIGHLSFIFLTIPWREWARKVIQNELFWIGIVFIICAIGRDSTSEWICFLASIIFLGISGFLFLCRTNSLLLATVLAGVCAILLVSAVPSLPSYTWESLSLAPQSSLSCILGSIVMTWYIIMFIMLGLYFALAMCVINNH